MIEGKKSAGRIWPFFFRTKAIKSVSLHEYTRGVLSKGGTPLVFIPPFDTIKNMGKHLMVERFRIVAAPNY